MSEDRIKHCKSITPEENEFLKTGEEKEENRKIIYCFDVSCNFQISIE